VALPSRLKTPALAEALKPIRGLEERALKDHEETLLSGGIDLEKLKAEEGALRDLLKAAYKGKENKGTPEKLGEQLRGVRERRRDLEAALSDPRYIVNDTTVEKLIELLRANPNGLLVERDELTGLLQYLDREDRKGDREFYLEAWPGDRSHTSDRIGRGTVRAPSVCLSIVGGMQPGKLSRYVSDAISGKWFADGLLQRFQLLVWPEDWSEWKLVDREPNRKAKEQAFRVFRSLDELTDEPESRRFSPDAQRFFNVWWTDLETRLHTPDLAEAEAFLSHLGKYRSLMPSLALVSQLCSESAEERVTLEAAKQAADWCDLLELHARKVYAAELHTGLEAAHALAGKIKRRLVEDGMALRDIYRKGWSHLGTADQVDEALAVLADCGWARTEVVESGGRPSQILRVNPEVFES